MAALSFRNSNEELRVGELAADDTIRFQCEMGDDGYAWAKIDLNVGDVELIIEWLQKQIQKSEPKSNG